MPFPVADGLKLIAVELADYRDRFDILYGIEGDENGFISFRMSLTSSDAESDIKDAEQKYPLIELPETRNSDLKYLARVGTAASVVTDSQAAILTCLTNIRSHEIRIPTSLSEKELVDILANCEITTMDEYAKKALYPAPTPDSNPVYLSFFDECYARATAEQREKLDDIGQYWDGRPGDCYRKIMQAMGELDEDHPRITLEQARAICREEAASCETQQEAVIEALGRIDEIAGACDFYGGSGVNATYYFLNDEGTECLWSLFCGNIVYINSITGVSEQLLPQE